MDVEDTLYTHQNNTKKKLKKHHQKIIKIIAITEEQQP